MISFRNTAASVVAAFLATSGAAQASSVDLFGNLQVILTVNSGSWTSYSDILTVADDGATEIQAGDNSNIGGDGTGTTGWLLSSANELIDIEGTSITFRSTYLSTSAYYITVTGYEGVVTGITDSTAAGAFDGISYNNLAGIIDSDPILNPILLGPEDNGYWQSAYISQDGKAVSFLVSFFDDSNSDVIVDFTFASAPPPPPAIPIPMSAALLLTGLGGLAAIRRRKG
jgi:hypothetical protein